MVYELKSADTMLIVQITRGADDSSEQWHVQARSDVESALAPIDGWGSTRAEALSDAAQAWSAHSPSLALFDWDAIAQELRLVRAL